jgi:hypothetical protein
MNLQTLADVSQIAAALTVIGGFAVVTWHRLEPWITELRVEQLEQRRAEKVPACVRHRGWSP